MTITRHAVDIVCRARPGVRLLLRRLGVVLALCLAVVATAACRMQDPRASDPDSRFIPADQVPLPPSLDPIVIPHPGAEAPGGLPGRVRDRRPVDEEDAGWADKLEVAQGYATGGYEEQALTLIRAALAQEPPAPWDERFEHLRSTLRVRQVETTLMRVDARGVRDYVEFDTPVDWRMRIRNVTADWIVFPAPKHLPGEPSPTALSLNLLRRDVDIYGAELRRTWNHTVYLQQTGGSEIRVPPGGVREVPARIPAADVGSAISGLRILELTGTLRGRIRDCDGGMRGVSLDIRPGRVVVLSPGYEPLAQDPLGSLERAVQVVAPTHLLVATEFVPRQDAARAMETLAKALAVGDPALRTAALGGISLLRDRSVGQPLAPFAKPLLLALQEHPEGAEAVMQGLTRATGQALAPDPRLWVDWWRRTREAGWTVPTPDSAPDAAAPEEDR